MQYMNIVKDYLGNTASYMEYSSTHLENSDYSLSLAETYVNYLLGIEILER